MAYAYKKKITLAGSSGAGTNYQVKLTIGESSGSTGANFHLGGHSAKFPTTKGDGGDLKFFASNESTVLDFWVESVSGTTPNRTAVVWLEVQADLGTNQDIWIYYGDSGAANLSNGANTFLLFDDFAGTSIDSGKWAVSTGGGGDSVSVSGDSVIVASDASTPMKTVQSISSLTGDFALRYSSKCSAMTSGNNLGIGLMDANQSDGNGQWFFYTLLSGVYNFSSFSRATGSWTNNWSSQGSYTLNTFDLYDFKLVGTTFSFFKNGSQVGTNVTKSLGTNRYINFTRWWNEATPDGGTVYFDFIAVRKLISTEPAFSSAAAEQTTSIPVSITVSATGSVSITKSRIYLRTITVNATGTASLSKLRTLLKTISTTAMASVSRTRQIFKNIVTSATAQATIEKMKSMTLAVAAFASPVFNALKIGPPKPKNVLRSARVLTPTGKSFTIIPKGQSRIDKPNL